MKCVVIFEIADAQCPVRIDAFTTLERIEVMDDVNVEYRYRVSKQGSKMVQETRRARYCSKSQSSR